MGRLTEEIPDHYWTALQYQENNWSISQPANAVYVMVYRDFIVLGFKKGAM